MRRIVLIGSGGHGRSVIDSIESAGEYEIAGFVGPESCSYRGYRTLGDDGDLVRLRKEGIECAFVGLGYLGSGTRRQELFALLCDIGYEIPPVVDPSAILAAGVSIGAGAYVGKGAIINAGATVGDMAIVNTNAVVEHDCVVESFSHVSVSATLCGSVSVGEASFVGAAATVCQGLSIGKHALVGANSTVLRSVADGLRVVGVYNG